MPIDHYEKQMIKVKFYFPLKMILQLTNSTQVQ